MENNYVKNIKELNNELKNKIVEDIPEASFDPPNIGSFIDCDPKIDTNYSSKDKEEKSISIFEGYKSFYGEENNNNELDNNKKNTININYNCSICNKNKAFVFVKNAIKFFVIIAIIL